LVNWCSKFLAPSGNRKPLLQLDAVLRKRRTIAARPRVEYALWFSPLMDHLAILSQTIADHARKLAYEEWKSEHGNFLEEILRNSGLKNGSTLDVDGRPIPIESVVKALREEFLKARVAQLVPKLTDSVVSSAFKKVIDEEQK
jgi:hypothetical protein